MGHQALAVVGRDDCQHVVEQVGRPETLEDLADFRVSEPDLGVIVEDRASQIVETPPGWPQGKACGVGRIVGRMRIEDVNPQKERLARPSVEIALIGQPRERSLFGFVGASVGGDLHAAPTVEVLRIRPARGREVVVEVREPLVEP